MASKPLSLEERTKIAGRAPAVPESKFRRSIRRVRAGLDRRDAELLAPTLRQYDDILARLDENLAALGDRINAAAAAGEEIKPSWLYTERRYQKLLADYEKQMDGMLKDLRRRIDAGESSVVKMALRDARTTLEAVTDRTRDQFPAGARPRPDTLAIIGESFDTIDPGTVAQAVSQTLPGTPLADLLATIAPAATDEITSALVYGISTGESIADTIRNARRFAEVPATRIRTIVRTETLRAYREATRASYAASDLIDGWTWHSALDMTTCAVCWARHGSRHPASEVMATHPNCRCTMLPDVKSWKELGFRDLDELPTSIEPKGSELFAKLTDAEQRTILGPSRFEAYKSGLLDLDDLPAATYSRFGPGVRQKSLRELGLKRAGSTRPTIPEPKPTRTPPPQPTPAPKPTPPPAPSVPKTTLPDGPAKQVTMKARPSKAQVEAVDDMADDIRRRLDGLTDLPDEFRWRKIRGSAGGNFNAGVRGSGKIEMDVRGTPGDVAHYYAHEMGHFLDYIPGGFADFTGRRAYDRTLKGLGSAERQELLDVLNDTKNARELAKIIANPSSYPGAEMYSPTALRRYARYMHNDVELLARAVAEYFGRTGSAASRESFEAHLRKRLAGSPADRAGYGIDDNDWKRVEAALEKWFRAIGVMK